MVARLDIEPLKFYSVSRELKEVCRDLTVKSHSTFAIFHDKDSPEANELAVAREMEVVIVSLKVVDCFHKFFPSDIVLSITNTHLLSAIANHLELTTPQDYKTLLELFSSPETLKQSKEGGELWNLCRQVPKNVILLQNLLDIQNCPFTQFRNKIEKELGGKSRLIVEVLDRMEKLHDSMEEFFTSAVVNVEYSLCSPLFKRCSFHSGITFSISAYRKLKSSGINKRNESVAIELMYGGRMDNLIEGFKPRDNKTRTFGCALVIKNYELFNFIRLYGEQKKEYPKVDISVYTGTSVLVIVPSSDLYELSLYTVARCWQLGVKAELLFNGPLTASDISLNSIKKRGVSYLLTPKKFEEGQPMKVAFKSLKSSKREDMLLDDAIQEIVNHHVVYDNFTTRRDKDLIDNFF